MISDTLSEAISEIDFYLAKMPNVYLGFVPQCLAVRGAMEELRIALDAAPETKTN